MSNTPMSNTPMNSNPVGGELAPASQPTPRRPASDEPWGKANPRRGESYRDKARAFREEFPIGTTLSPEQFDAWAQKRGYLNVPTGAPKQSDAWMAYLQRRHNLRYSMNKAAEHPQMEPPFTIAAVRQGLWEVRSVQQAISGNTMFQSLQSLTQTKRKQLGYLMQSADWEVVPAHMRALAEALYDDIDMLRESIEVQCRHLTNKFSKLETRLRQGVESGRIEPANGGIQRLIAPPPPDAEAFPDDGGDWPD